MDPLKVYITLEVFVRFFGKCVCSMHWIFQRRLKSGRSRSTLSKIAWSKFSVLQGAKRVGRWMVCISTWCQSLELTLYAPSAPVWLLWGGDGGKRWIGSFRVTRAHQHLDDMFEKRSRRSLKAHCHSKHSGPRGLSSPAAGIVRSQTWPWFPSQHLSSCSHDVISFSRTTIQTLTYYL